MKGLIKIVALICVVVSMGQAQKKNNVKTAYLKNGDTFEFYTWASGYPEKKEIKFYLNPGNKMKSATTEYPWEEVDSFTNEKGDLLWVLKDLDISPYSTYEVAKAKQKGKIVYIKGNTFDGTYHYYYSYIYSYEKGYWNIEKIKGKSKKQTKRREILKTIFEKDSKIVNEIEDYGTAPIKSATIEEWVKDYNRGHLFR